MHSWKLTNGHSQTDTPTDGDIHKPPMGCISMDHIEIMIQY